MSEKSVEWIAKIEKDGVAWLEPPSDSVQVSLTELFLKGLVKMGIAKDGVVYWKVSGIGEEAAQMLAREGWPL